MLTTGRYVSILPRSPTANCVATLTALNVCPEDKVRTRSEMGFGNALRNCNEG